MDGTWEIDQRGCLDLLAARIDQLIEWEGIDGPIGLSIATAGRTSSIAAYLALGNVRRALIARLAAGSRLVWRPEGPRLDCTVADEQVTIYVSPL